MKIFDNRLQKEISKKSRIDTAVLRIEQSSGVEVYWDSGTRCSISSNSHCVSLLRK